MQPHFSWRKPSAADLPTCLALHPAKNGAEAVGNGPCLRAWEQMLGNKHATRPAVVERRIAGCARIVGFGFGVFVRTEFAEKELSHPQPGLNARIVAAIVAGRDPLASLDEIAVENARGELRQIVLDASWDDALSPSERDEVRIVLGVAYAERFAGYRIRKIISEIVDSRDAFHAEGLSKLETVSRFEEFYATNPHSAWNSGRSLAVANADFVRAHFDSIAAGVLFQRHLPDLGFSQGEKDLLEAASDGLDDVAAAAELGLTLSAIKKRWSSIFGRAAEAMPELCPSDASDTRGTQKRHRILAYVRQHPEELRPFDDAQLAIAASG